jgi:DGQHR domain-containing protein
MFVPTSSRGPRARTGEGFPFDGQRFRQGQRIAYSTVFPFSVLSQIVDVGRIGAADNDRNRPIKKAHLDACEYYLDTEEEFVLGGILLAAEPSQVAFQANDDEVNTRVQKLDDLYFRIVSMADGPERNELIAEYNKQSDELKVCDGQLWIPYGERLEVTDGQHRVKVLIDRITYIKQHRGKLSEWKERLIHSSQGIPVMILVEPRVWKRQQDFVDLGQTEAISVNIKIGMDHRQPVTKLIRQMVEDVPIFAERFVEFKRPSIRKSSDELYSLANLNTMLQAMLLGSTRLSKQQAQRRMTELLEGPAGELHQDRAIAFFRELSDRLGVFSRILEDPDAVDYQHLREEFICLNSLGLAVMGMVGHELIRQRATVEQVVEAIARTDWKRSNLLWDGTLRVGAGIARGGNVAELGAAIVKAMAGMSLSARDLGHLRSVEGLQAKLPAGALDAQPITEPENPGRDEA